MPVYITRLNFAKLFVKKKKELEKDPHAHRNIVNTWSRVEYY